MGKLIDISGQKFGNLLVLEYLGKERWKCLCDCGNITTSSITSLKSGHKKSCGCLHVKSAQQQGIKNIKHGFARELTGTEKLYRTWLNMKARCYNPKRRDYKNYGAKGIQVCDDWKNNFVNFKDWALNSGYTDGLTIDRIQNDKGYFPHNCRWVTMKQQQRNTTRNHFVTYNGQTKCIAEWESELNMNHGTLATRLKNGWDIEKAFTQPIRKSTRWNKEEIEHE